MSTFSRTATGLLLALVAASNASSQVVYPTRPETVDVQIRYRISAARDERVRQFRVLEQHLRDVGFQKTRKPDDDLDILDPTAERFEGSIASKNVFALLDDPRVKTILFKPTDYQYPADIAAPISLRLRISTGFLPPEQHRFHKQIVEQLARMGFREMIGYDRDRYTLIRGDLPFGNLFRLMKDLRTQPAGWFLPDTMPNQLPAPLKDVLPIRSIEVLANADLAFLNVAAVAPNRERYTPDLRAILDDMAAQAKPIRVEAVMERKLSSEDLDFIRSRLRGRFSREVVNPTTKLNETEHATLEGVVGNVATIHFPQAVDVERFVLEPGVVLMRLPRAAIQTVEALPANAKAVPAAEVLAATRVSALQKAGYRGQGTRIVVIATEFPELAAANGKHYLDQSLQTPVKFIDLTAELSAILLPAPPGTPAAAGTAAARAAHLAAPDASLILVRVEAAAFYQVYNVARFVRGDLVYTEAMHSRINELSLKTDELRRKNTAAVDEYRRAFQDFGDDETAKLRRERAKKVLDLLILEEADHAEAIRRATALQSATRDLAGSDVVVNTLVWETGFELDGLSELAQFIDTSFASEALSGPRNRSASRPQPTPRPLWVQAASPSIGSVWGGPFLDGESNSIMDFAFPDQKIPAREWTRELNFLGTRSPDGSATATLTTGAKIRLTVQWREAHDPNGYGGLESIFPISIRVFQQLDPEGKVRASDELTEIARSNGGPYRVYSAPTCGVYEQIVEFAVPADGRYCVMLEGSTTYDSRLPALQRHIEVQPRMFAEFLVATPDKGRPIFASFAPKDAGIGLPGDAKAAVAVGTLTGGLTGGGTGVTLLLKPDVLADGSIDVGAKATGPGVAAGYAGGVFAGLIGSGAPPVDVFGATGLLRGGPLNVPEGWLKAVPKRR